MLTRRLEVAFLLSNDPFAFRCSLCSRLFVPRGLEVTPEEFVNIDSDVHPTCLRASVEGHQNPGSQHNREVFFAPAKERVRCFSIEVGLNARHGEMVQ